MIRKVFAAASICLFLATQPVVAEPDTLFTATYRGEFSGWNAKMTRSLIDHGDGVYEFSSVAKNLFAAIRETSRFELDADKVVPLDYQYQRNVFGRKAVESLEFDWDKNNVRYEHTAKPYKNTDLTLEGPVLDPSLYQLFMQRDAFLGDEQPTAHFVKRGRFRTYEFKLQGEDKIEIGGKQRRALVYHKKDDESHTVIWLMPNLDYQIGRIVHKDEDGEYSLEMVEYHADQEALRAFYRTSTERQPTPVDNEGSRKAAAKPSQTREKTR